MFQYSIIDDAAPAFAATAFVNLVVAPPGLPPPAAVNDVYVCDNTKATCAPPVSILVNDSTPNAGGALVIPAYTQPALGSVTVSPQGLVNYTLPSMCARARATWATWALRRRAGLPCNN